MVESVPGSALALNDELIAYVSHHYNGRIYLYRKISPGEWAKNDTIEGYRYIQPTVSIRTSQSGMDERSHLTHWTPEGYRHFEFHSISFGLFPQDDDSIIHLSYMEENGKMHLVYEQFDPEERQLESYAVIDEIEIDHIYRKEPGWMDREGHIYLKDNSNIPKVRKLKLTAN